MTEADVRSYIQSLLRIQMQVDFFKAALLTGSKWNINAGISPFRISIFKNAVLDLEGKIEANSTLTPFQTDLISGIFGIRALWKEFKPDSTPSTEAVLEAHRCSSESIHTLVEFFKTFIECPA